MSHLKVTTERIVCKYCSSPRVVKHGSYKGRQWWLCRDCGRAWTDNSAVDGGKLPAECVAYTLGAYYDGLSLNAIRRSLKQQYDVYPSGATVYEWVDRYTKKAVAETEHLKPKVGNIWIADESYVRIDQRKDNPDQVDNPYSKSKRGKWVIFWDIIDADTRFLLASLVTTTRGIDDAKKLMELASKRAGKVPRVVVTDKLRAYIDGIEQAYGADTKHKQGGPFNVEANTNLIERFHGSLKARTKVMRGLRSPESTKLFTDGWLAFYNYLRPHMSLGKTPAEAASVKCPFHDWSDFIGVRSPVCVDEEIIREAPSLSPHTSSPRRVKQQNRRARIMKVETSVRGLRL
ncbi:transposase [Chloroflexota bacterium]